MGLTLVDSSVWIDLLLNRTTLQTLALERLLDGKQPVGIGDLILMEVLQGTRSERQFQSTLAFLDRFVPVTIVDRLVSVAAARHFRALRARGVTVRKTIDTLIATRCILDDIPLLYRDRDFDPFVAQLGLRSALDISGVQ